MNCRNCRHMLAVNLSGLCVWCERPRRAAMACVTAASNPQNAFRDDSQATLWERLVRNGGTLSLDEFGPPQNVSQETFPAPFDSQQHIYVDHTGTWRWSDGEFVFGVFATFADASLCFCGFPANYNYGWKG